MLNKGRLITFILGDTQRNTEKWKSFITEKKRKLPVCLFGGQWKQCQTSFIWAPKSLQMVTIAMKLKYAYSLEEKL